VEYLEGEAYLTFFDERGGLTGGQGPYSVANGEVWVLGDNRTNSFDSRAWFDGRGGGVPLDHVKARALFRWLSFDAGDGSVDWSRYGTSLSEPLLPRSMKALASGLAKCLQRRPPRQQTVPPPRKETTGRNVAK
jgi:signal peptidase I